MLDWQVEVRKQRGMEIAALMPIQRKGAVWLVPSRSTGHKYTVSADASAPHCTCPDHENTGGRCKHIHAVEYVIERERHEDGSETVTERLTVETTRKTYPQDWTAYNAAQTSEKHEFQSLLFDLCQTVPSPPQTMGRPRLPMSDAVFTTTFKVYSTFSGRRFMSDLRDAHERGYISRVPHFNSIFNQLKQPEMGSILTGLVQMSARPLAVLEDKFACDSTGFTTNRFVPWFDKKYRAWNRREHDWVKVHLMCGVRTNVVTAVTIKERDASDTKQLPELLATTAQNFDVREVSADKGYSSVYNHIVIGQHGATPLIAFKNNANGARGGAFGRAFHYYSLHREEFLQRYHRRSNVESTMSMIKAKFRDDVRSRTDTAMTNEVLCKVLAHNICCLIQSTREFGVDLDFTPRLVS